MQFNGKPGMVLWAEGTVKEMSGRPLVKADVYLRTAHHGGIRMYEDILATTTDAQGHYSFSGEVHPTTESPVLVAKVKGRPPAVVNAEARTVENDRPAKVDLTVADVGGSASVTVLRDGKPLPNARVQLEATGSAAILSGFGWAAGSGGPEKAAFEAIVEPSAVTDRDGVARFGELIPGLYTVHATDNSQGVNRQLGESSRRTASAPARWTAWRSWPDARRRRSCRSPLPGPRPGRPHGPVPGHSPRRPSRHRRECQLPVRPKRLDALEHQHEGRRSGDRRACVHIGRSLERRGAVSRHPRGFVPARRSLITRPRRWCRSRRPCRSPSRSAWSESFTSPGRFASGCSGSTDDRPEAWSSCLPRSTAMDRSSRPTPTARSSSRG